MAEMLVKKEVPYSVGFSKNRNHSSYVNLTPWQHTLTAIFSSQLALDEKALEALLSCWKHPKTLRRHEYLAQPGQVESSLFFVLEGTMRIYFPNDEDEICVGFSYSNTLICSYPSFILQKPSQYFIQALSKTKLMAISRADFYNLFEVYPRIERCWRMMEEQALLGKIEREVEMLTFSPEERYKRLLDRSPHVFQIIPRKYIASYLRMSPETLSRLRPS